jgi:hypothetical protein
MRLATVPRLGKGAEFLQQLLEDIGRRGRARQQDVQNPARQVCTAIALDEQFGERRLAGTRFAGAEQTEGFTTTVRCDGHVDLRQALVERGVDDARRPQSLRGRRPLCTDVSDRH